MKSNKGRLGRELPIEEKSSIFSFFDIFILVTNIEELFSIFDFQFIFSNNSFFPLWLRFKANKTKMASFFFYSKETLR